MVNEKENHRSGTRNNSRGYGGKKPVDEKGQYLFAVPSEHRLAVSDTHPSSNPQRGAARQTGGSGSQDSPSKRIEEQDRANRQVGPSGTAGKVLLARTG